MSRRYDERDERSYDRDYDRTGRRSESDYERNRGSYGASRDYDDYNRERDYARDYSTSGGARNYGREGSYSGSYGGTTGRDYGSDYGRGGYSGSSYGGSAYGSRSSRGDYERNYGNREQEERGFLDRAGDEIRSWFGDDEAERRRRMDEQRSGQHRGRGPRGYRRSDDRIKEDVNDRLSDHDYLDASDVEVSVDNSEVTLSGTVNSRYDKRLAEDIAESVSGVTHVQNNLRVSQSQYGTSTTGTTGSSMTGTSTTGTTDTSATGTTGASVSGAAAGTSTGGSQRTKTS